MRWLALVVVLAALGCKKPGSVLTDDQVLARPFEALHDVCLPRGADDTLVVIDEIFEGVTGSSDTLRSSSSRANNRMYYRLTTYDAKDGARHVVAVLGNILTEKHRTSPVTCLGWVGTKLWLRGRDGLQARDIAGRVAVTEKQLGTLDPKLASGIEGASYLADDAKLLVQTPAGYQLLLSGDPELVVEEPHGRVHTERYASGVPAIQSRIARGLLRRPMRDGRLESELRGGRVYVSYRGTELGDFKHPVEALVHPPSKTVEWDGQSIIAIEPGLDPKAPRTVRRVGLDGKTRWSIVEPERCPRRHGCPQAAWQATTDAKRLYFYGAKQLHAYDAETGAQIWAVAY